MTSPIEPLQIILLDFADARASLSIWYTAIIIIFFLFNRKRKRAYGIVFDASTHRPLSYAIVALLRENGAVTRTAVTDEKGRYRITAPEGNYHLSVSRSSYLSISPKFEGKKGVGSYQHMYSGGVIPISHDNPVVALDIPLDPQNPGSLPWFELMKIVWFRIEAFVKALFVLLTLLWMLKDPGLRPLILLIIETVVYAASRIRWSLRSHRWGIVKNARTGKPVPFAKVELIDSKTSQLIETSSTDMSGRYNLLVVDFRKMYIRCRRPGYRSYRSDTLRFFGIRSEKVDLVGIDIALEPDPASSAKKRGEVTSFLEISHEDLEAQRATLSGSKDSSDDEE